MQIYFGLHYSIMGTVPKKVKNTSFWSLARLTVLLEIFSSNHRTFLTKNPNFSIL